MNILLIGPMGVGKSSVAKLLSAQLALPLVDVDALRWAQFGQMPEYDNNIVEAFFENNEGEKAFSYMKPFEARLVENLLGQAKPGVYDFGAGYTVYDDPALFARVQRAFAPYENVLFLRYSDDAEESLAALLQRHDDIPVDLYYALNRPFLNSPCNGLLARHTIDTKDKSIKQVATEALYLIQ